VSKNTTRETICLTVARMLRTERQRQGLSMERLAEKAGLSTSMISLFERDLRNPTLDTLLRIAEVMDVDLGRLIQRATAEARRAKQGWISD